MSLLLFGCVCNVVCVARKCGSALRAENRYAHINRDDHDDIYFVEILYKRQSIKCFRNMMLGDYIKLHHI